LTHEGIQSAEVAGPGFINITLDAGSAGELVKTIVEAGESYGQGTELAGQVINVEYVSANPTGPLHIGHTRWAALGDSLVRVLRAAGASVTSEFYINDQGVQMDKFGLSVIAAAEGSKPARGWLSGGVHPGLSEEGSRASPRLADTPWAHPHRDRPGSGL
jgi:arginyl-tRNA synthetase